MIIIICMCVYIYIYIYMCLYIYIYIYTIIISTISNTTIIILPLVRFLDSQLLGSPLWT